MPEERGWRGSETRRRQILKPLACVDGHDWSDQGGVDQSWTRGPTLVPNDVIGVERVGIVFGESRRVLRPETEGSWF